jgi:integrase/recombinase XerD
MRLLLEFAQHRLRTPAAQLDLAQLDADLIAAFLDHVEHKRQNTIATRNARLAAIRSLYTFASLRHPEHASVIARVLAIPPKRHDRTLITHLTDPAIEALLNAPDADTWIGRRDRAMLHLAIETGGATLRSDSGQDVADLSAALKAVADAANRLADALDRSGT